MRNQELKNISYCVIDVEKICLQICEQYKLECLRDLHDTIMFYLTISLLIGVWVILCLIRYYLVCKSGSTGANDRNGGNWALIVIASLMCMFSGLFLSDAVYSMDETMDDIRVYTSNNQWYWPHYEDTSEFDFSVSANNYHITDFGKVEELAMEIRQLDRDKISITDRINYTQDHNFSCLYSMYLELNEIISANPAINVNSLLTEQSFTNFLESDRRDDSKYIESAISVYDYLESKLDIIKESLFITEEDIEDTLMAEQGLDLIRSEINDLKELGNKLDICDHQLVTKYHEWNYIKDALSYSDPYSFVYDPTNETSEDYFRDNYSDYETHISEMDFSNNDLLKGWDQLPFHDLSSEQVEETVKTKKDVWVDYQDMEKAMQNMFELPY